MKGRQIAGWALAASVVVGVPVGVLLAPLPAVLGQSPELREAEQLLEQVRKLQAQGRYTDAISLVQKGLSIQEKTLGADHPNLTNTLHLLATLYDLRGDQEQALALYRRALAINEKAYSTNSPKIIESLSLLAQQIGKNRGGFALWDEADLHQRIISLEKSTNKPNQARIAESLKRIGQYYLIETSEKDKGLSLYEDALKIIEKVYGSESFEAGKTLRMLSRFYDMRYRKNNSNQASERALTIYKNILFSQEKLYGSNSPKLTELLTALADLYYWIGRGDEAIKTYQRIVSINANAYGERSFQFADSLKLLADFYSGTNQNKQALELYQRIVNIKERIYGVNHPDTLKALEDLAYFYLYEEKKYELALELYQRIVGIREKSDGIDSPDIARILKNVSYFHQVIADYELKKKMNSHPFISNLYKQIVDTEQKSKVTDSLETIESLQSLAHFHKEKGELKEALALYERIVAINEKAHGVNSPKIIDSLDTLADFHKEKGDLKKALALYERIVAINEKAHGVNSPKIIDSLDTLADFHKEKGDLKKALALYERIVAINEKAHGVNSPKIIDSLNKLADFHKEKGDLKKALALYKRIVAINEKAYGVNSPKVIDLKKNLPLLTQPANLVEAEQLYRQAIQLRNQGRHGEAIPLAKRSLAIREKALSANDTNVIQSLNLLANLYESQGNYAEAYSLYRRSSNIIEKTLEGIPPDVATRLNNLAESRIRDSVPGRSHPESLRAMRNIYKLIEWQNNYEKYQKSLTKEQNNLAIQEENLLKENLENDQVAIGLYGLAVQYESQGNFDKAIALVERSLAIIQKLLGDRRFDLANDSLALQYVRNLNMLAVLHVYQNNYAKAIPLVERSLAIREENLGANHLDVEQSRSFLASLYQQQGKYSQALPLLQRNLTTQEKTLGTDNPGLAYSLDEVAFLYQLQGQYAQAESLYQRSLTIREKALGVNDSEVALSLNNLAGLYQEQGNYTQALPLLQRSTNIEEIHLAKNLALGSEEYRRNYLKTFADTTDGVISFHLQSVPNNPQAARLSLTTILRRKGRVLDTLSQNLSRLRQQLSPADQERLTRLSALRTQVAQIAFNPNPTDQQRQQLQLLNTQAEQIETELNRSSAAFAQTTQKVTLEAVQKAIPQNAALVEFIEYQPFNPRAPQGKGWGSPRYAVYVLTSTGEPRFADLGSASEIDALVSQYRSATLDPRRPISEAQAAARTLDAKIMAPVRRLVGSATHLLIAPDGQLNLVAFAGLVDEKNQYLIENYLITYLTSGRDLLRLQTAPPKANPPLIVANPTFDKPGSNPVQIASADRSNPRSIDLATLKFTPLPATAIEGETIAKLLPNSRLFTQAQATETVVKTSNNPRILHLATHGFFLKPAPITQAKDDSQNLPNENPLLRSGLAFSGFNVRQGGGDDGVLTALEITGMDLRGTQLVVLSACETGLGDVQSGEGVYGLRRAFTLAGAQSQVMTLWRVDDNATKDLMVNYYQRLAKGEGRGEALRQAQLAMLKSPNYAHPKYWSGMIPAGDWRGMSP